jgi:NADP-dependent 3-hydroxy acid dehydrogenase YdfG
MMSFELESRGTRSAVINLEFGAHGGHTNMLPKILNGAPLPEPCSDLEPQDIRSASGQLDLFLDGEKASALFPQLMTNLPSGQIALLLATSRLVGMRCPGRNSIYSQIHLSFGPPQPDDDPSLTWQAEDFDNRFNLTTISLSTSGATGTLKAFFRPPPQQQPSTREIQSRVPARCFQQHRALVLGGSRGIGEVCAKILAAGGADVYLTYHRGSEDAARVVRDITSAGGSARTFAFDVLGPSSALVTRLAPGWFPTHVYFFPTPSIFGRAVSGKFTHELFFSFYDFYVRGVTNVHNELRSISNQPFEFFFASSVAVNDPPTNMGEYAAAKAAGEMLCHFLSKTDRNLKVRVERLPRLPTDQTVDIYGTFPDESTVDVVGTLLQILSNRS